MKAKRLALLAACVVGAGMLAGTALGGTSTWQDVWVQIKPLLSNPGTINSADNPVHWTKLKGVPAGLADGVDNGVDRAGFGLKKNVFPQVEFAVDPSTIQRRVTGTCPVGQTIQSIASDGTATCAPGAPVVYHGQKDPAESQPIYANYVTVGGVLDVPAGAWTIVANLSLGSVRNLVLACVLEARAGGAVSVRDHQRVAVDSPSQGPARIPLTLTGVHVSAQPWQAAVRCRYDNGPLANDQDPYWERVKITVTQAGELHSEQLHF